MTLFPAAHWLEHARIAAQSVWFVAFLGALSMTLAALFWNRSRFFSLAARRLWALAMLMTIAFWLAGATLEMMRRAAPISGLQMTMALGAFSFLVAGVLSLVREWFGVGWNDDLRAAKIAWSLLILTLAGRWLGGFALESNALYRLSFPASNAAQIPDAWALFLGGAALLAASRAVFSPDESVRRARNPRLPGWSLALLALLLCAPFGIRNGGAASVLVLAGGVFLVKIWRSRTDCPRFLRAAPIFRVAAICLLAMLPLVNSHANFQSIFQLSNGVAMWRETHQIAAWCVLILMVAIGVTSLRRSLRKAISGRFADRALIHGTLAGSALATLVFGPGGALFWAFWPLCGLFFDLLASREPISNSRTDLADPDAERDAENFAT